MTDRDAMELAYGLLWMVGCDRSTKAGEALYLARKALYEKMDRAGQARGIDAAQKALGVEHIGARTSALTRSLREATPFARDVSAPVQRPRE
jgi:hypothetical protein